MALSHPVGAGSWAWVLCKQQLPVTIEPSLQMLVRFCVCVWGGVNTPLEFQGSLVQEEERDFCSWSSFLQCSGGPLCKQRFS